MAAYENLRAIIAQNIRYLRKTSGKRQQQIASRAWLSLETSSS